MTYILLADDSVTIQKVVELTFMEGNYEIRALGNGDDALSAIDERTPDMVIADVHMPGAGGLDICRRVKADHPEVPVLLLVGTFEPFEPDEARASGADAHLMKPFDSQELLRLVEELTARRAEAAAARVAAKPSGADELPDLAGETLPLGGELGATWQDSDAAAPTPTTATEAEAGEAPSAGNGGTEAVGKADDLGLSEDQIDSIARRVAELLSDRVVREVVWEVVPDLAEIVIKDRLRELESQVDSLDN